MCKKEEQARLLRVTADEVWAIAKKNEVNNPELAKRLKGWSSELHDEAYSLERAEF